MRDVKSSLMYVIKKCKKEETKMTIREILNGEVFTNYDYDLEDFIEEMKEREEDFDLYIVECDEEKGDCTMAIKAAFEYLKKNGYIDNYNIPLNISFASDEILEDLKATAEENGIKPDYTIRLYIEDMQGIPAFMDFDVLECDFRTSRHVDVTLEDAIKVLELQNSIID